jgi:hypothetical protein
MSTPWTSPRSAALALLICFFLTNPMLAGMALGIPPSRDATEYQGPVDLFLNNGANGQLIPTPVGKETAEQINMLGSQPPVPAIPVGRWTTAQIKFPISISGPFSCTLWADSQKGAKNSYFVVDIYVGSTSLGRFNTSKKGLSMSPTRFDVSGELNAELATGGTLSATVYFYADWVVNPGSIFPQPAQATFLYGGGQYTSGIMVTTLPILVSVLKPAVENGVDYIVFSSKVKEAFDADLSKMFFNMTIEPPVGCEMAHTSKADVRKTEDGITFSVDWNYTKDKAVDGDFIVTMRASYDGNRTFTNTSTFNIKVPHKQVTGIEETPMQPLIMGSAGFGLVLVFLAVYVNRKTIFKGRYGTKKALPKEQPRTKAKEGGPKERPRKVERSDEDDGDDR